jgi:DNA repair protein RecO (recombination protein O)
VELRTDALVLRAVAYGEADRVLTLATRTHGKLSAIARGARKSTKRFGGLALFVVGEATLKDRRGAELLTLDGWLTRQDYSRLASDVVAMAHASYGAELLRELTAARQPEPRLFDLLVDLYAVLAAAPPRSDTLRAFELKLLDELGFGPVLDECAGCGALACAAIDPGRGGAVCASCAAASRAEGVRPLGAAARDRLARVRALSLAEVATLEPAGADVDADARRATHALLGAHLHGPMKSLEFIHKLRNA